MRNPIYYNYTIYIWLAVFALTGLAIASYYA